MSEAFSEKIKRERKRIGMSQKETAAFLGVCERVFWDWEAGKTTPYEITQEGALRRLARKK